MPASAAGRPSREADRPILAPTAVAQPLPHRVPRLRGGVRPESAASFQHNRILSSCFNNLPWRKDLGRPVIHQSVDGFKTVNASALHDVLEIPTDDNVGPVD